MSRPPLFNYAAICDASLDGQTICIADDLFGAEALTAEGLAATCKVGRSRRWTQECSQALANAAAKRVIVCYRHDEPDALTGRRLGHERARWIALSLRDAGVRRVSYRRSASAASIAAHLRDGHTLRDLLDERPEGGRPDWDALTLIDIWREDEEQDAGEEANRPWQPADLTAIIRALETGEITAPTPTLLARTDGQRMIYRGELQVLAGEPSAGKGWIACEACVQVLGGGGRVLYLDFEEPRPFSVVSRPLALGVDRSVMVERFDYVRPRGVPQDALAELPVDDYALVVLDGVTDAMSMMGLNPDKGDEVERFLCAFAVPLAERGAAVLMIDHVVKAKSGRGRWAIGSEHKLAEVAAQFMVEPVIKPTRTSAGEVRLRLAKDRHGNLGAEGSVVATVEIIPKNGGATVSVNVKPPSKSKAADVIDAEPDGTSDADGHTPSPQKLFEVSKAIEQAATPPSAKQLRGLVGGNGQEVDAAADWLFRAGYTDTPIGRRARQWKSIKPFRIT